MFIEVLVTQSCLTPCDPVDCNPPGSSVHGILLARILEWVAILFSRGSSQPGDRTWVSGIVGRFDSLPSGPPGKPHCYIFTYLFFWLCWVFIAARRLSLSGESGSYSLVVIYRLVIVCNFSCCRARTLGAWASVVATQRRQWHPTPLLSPGKSNGQRSLVGCSPWGR